MQYKIYPYIITFSDDFVVQNKDIKSLKKEFDKKHYWVFDDENHGLNKEGLVAGTDTLIELMLKEKNIKVTDKFYLIFSDEKINNYDCKIKLLESNKLNGSWYYSDKYKLNNWLCPALFLYFKKAPDNLYIKINKE